MKRILFLLLGMALLASCSPNRDKEVKKIEEHEQALSTIDLSSGDSALNEMIALYLNFAEKFPNDSLAPIYMVRAADLNITLGMPDQAVALLDSVINLYPGFEDVGGCYFLKGYAYETAEQFDAAREAYTYFIDNYPEHYLASDTRKTLPYLGMTPEEMFDAIMSEANADALALTD
ncbi:MAG: tetratricopeptide repeat protein [Bacteroidales bacterium]|nr:tetratricopeptide repeat protein [Bacteroidales bacterium]